MRVIVIYVSLENLMDEESLQLSLFEDRTKERTLAKTMDAIRNRSELPFVRSQLHIRKRRQYPQQYEDIGRENCRDRGIIKFSPFLIPEHRKMLKELHEKEEKIPLLSREQ
ncbi:hypothetical protein [Parageobacillus thermoglucosidasius]|uniref:hypothetical protein n=1 Tax=Parageobacillus thermoglucosidasius TaxID=1426 RepID=UPI0027EA808F|nr:hypothetical protein PthstB1num2_32810 [Parageobacillus thermoglucosidasius]